MLLVHAACTCCWSRCMPILLIHHDLFCVSIPHANAHMSMLNVHPACKNCMSILHVNAACPCPLISLLLVNISTESYLFDILEHIGRRANFWLITSTGIRNFSEKLLNLTIYPTFTTIGGSAYIIFKGL
jgi:hypothetical protein